MRLRLRGSGGRLLGERARGVVQMGLEGSWRRI